MMKYIKNLLLISSIFSGTQGILAMHVNGGDPEALSDRTNSSLPSGQQENRPSKTAQASASNQNPLFKWYKKACEANKTYKQTIKNFILNNKDIQIRENFSLNPTRMVLWAGIASLSYLNWYHFEHKEHAFGEFDLGSLMLGHIAAELLETYPDLIRNHPIITPVATWCLSLFGLGPMDRYFYKNWKFFTGLGLVSQYTAYSTFTFKAIELLKWLKEGREEREESKLALETPEENPDSNRSEASTSSTLSMQTMDNPIANLQNDVLEFKQTLKNHPNHTQVEALIARVIAQEMAKYAQASGSKQTTLSHTLRKRNIKPTSKDPLESDDNAQQASFSLAPLVRMSSNEFPPDPTAIKLQPNSAQTPTISLDPEAGFIIAAGAHSAASSTDSSNSSLLGGNADSSLNE